MRGAIHCTVTTEPSRPRRRDGGYRLAGEFFGSVRGESAPSTGGDASINRMVEHPRTGVPTGWLMERRSYVPSSAVSRSAVYIEEALCPPRAQRPGSPRLLTPSFRMTADVSHGACR